MTNKAKATFLVNEALAFYANKFNIGVKDVVWAMEMGNEKVMADIAKLVTVGYLATTKVA